MGKALGLGRYQYGRFIMDGDATGRCDTPPDGNAEDDDWRNEYYPDSDDGSDSDTAGDSETEGGSDNVVVESSSGEADSDNSSLVDAGEKRIQEALTVTIRMMKDAAADIRVTGTVQ